PSRSICRHSSALNHLLSSIFCIPVFVLVLPLSPFSPSKIIHRYAENFPFLHRRLLPDISLRRNPSPMSNLPFGDYSGKIR
ncbi:MAG: hypothetical protein K5657_07910, partial [Desulfovibrio sp.]|nr:hypothetical protein [Desulfovibrio sp.]